MILIDLERKVVLMNYLEQLKNPKEKCKGLTRWWWYGCAVKKDEISKQLDEMKDKNIGGVEIQIMYPVTADDSESGRKNIEYFSPEFFDILDYTCAEAEKRGMTFDLTLGSSWPYGGPFVPFDLSAPIVHPYTIDVTGPCKFSYDFTTRISGDIVGCVMGKMEHSKMIPETIVDLTEKVTAKFLFNWPWGAQLEDIDIPEGDYKIVCFVSSKHRLHVLAPMKGAEGLTIDHNRKDAARLFFENAGTPIVEKLGRGRIQSFFCDSIEVNGHNWTDIMYDEFEKRRGYSLRPYIYALWGEVEGLTDKIRYDFQKTYAELTVENFFEEMTKWCHEVGSTSRIQAHGTWGDILKAYGAADIPEGECFSDFDKYTVNTIHRRLASSAGNVYNKPIISNESFTWLRFPRFTETLEQIKVATDSIFVDGMNQIVNHGFTYNPADGEEWPFYASSHICDKNTWWPFYKHMGNYIQRVSDFMQRGKTHAEVCIYLPQNDIWAENPLCDLHMCMKLRERFEDDAVDGIAKAGYWFDYVNDDVVSRVSEYGYKTMIIMETDRMPVETVKAIEKFAADGNLVICADRIPSMSCGLIGAEENAKYVKEAMESLLNSGKMLLAENKREALVSMLQENVVPDLEICDGKNDIGYIHKQDGDVHIYFVSNMSKNEYHTTLRFKNLAGSCQVFGPMEAKEKDIVRNEVVNGKKEIELTIAPLESLLIIFDEKVEDQKAVTELFAEAKKDISAEWKFKVADAGVDMEISELIPWQKLDELKYFAGTGIYKKFFVLSVEELEYKNIILSMENMKDCAKVYVNGNLAGDIIKYPYVIDIAEFLKTGVNDITIEVTNVLINRMIDPEIKTDYYEGTVIDEWPYFTKTLNACRWKRLSNWREVDMIKEPVDAGIWGTVELAFCK